MIIKELEMIEYSRQLKYKKIFSEIEKFISQSPAGIKLPSERELAKTFGCNALTVRKALAPFVINKKIVRIIGSGTFISESSVSDSKNITSVNTNPNRLGMLIHSESDPYALLVVRSCHEFASRKGIELRYSYVKDFGDEALREAGRFAAEGCCAIILPWFPSKFSGQVSDFIRKSPAPVSIPYLIPGLERNCFERQEVFGRGTIVQTEAACRYLQMLGHRSIALLGPDAPSDKIMQQRLGSYSSFTCRSDLSNICGLVGGTFPEMDALASKWSKTKDRLSVICHDDLHAIRFMAAMRKLGLSAPANFAIMGCNNTLEARFSDPPLTSIYDDYGYSGEWLARNALALAKGEIDQSSTNPRHHLVVRNSCGGLERINPKLISGLEASGIMIEYDKEPLISSMEVPA
ncbi:MAG: hypothetical protein A2X48_05930 [Lentisphaerae bacterium GWF2_49_21]|nr:MAG: hypothetical protein A2X48_05930 [Lentisphaerae bacterium GWF2_49_21]